MEIGNIYVVIWEDITSYSGWKEPADAKKLTTLCPISIGFLVEHSNTHVKLAQTEINHEANDSVGDVIIIPMSVVKGMYKLTESTMKNMLKKKRKAKK